MSNAKYKIVLLGESGVGKTSLVHRLIYNRFNVNSESTIGGAYTRKVIEINNNKIDLNIWDTAGQERYRAISNFFYRHAQGCLLVFDITDRKSFEMVRIWHKMFVESNEYQKYAIVIVANKCDNPPNTWMVSIKELSELSNELQCSYAFTNCKTDNNIDVFHVLAEKILLNNPFEDMIIIDDSEIIFEDKHSGYCAC